MRISCVGKALQGAAVLSLLVLVACSDDIQYVERPPFNPPPDSASGFLGYYAVNEDPAAGENFTTCGNCHADINAAWALTAHADAWEGLQGSGHSASYCEPCHTISENGNPLEGLVGYPALVADSANRPDSLQLAVYHDVQCESCHGPGNEHVATPEAAVPLASAYTGTDLTTGCGECHEGSHHPFVEQWEESAHNAGSGFGYAGTRSGCNECHNGKGALVEQFGVMSDYLEKDDGEVMTITCVVCHDPHSDGIAGQLRAPIDEGTTRNLCISCHNRRPTPSQTTHGFHAAQGPLVLGENIGWLPDSLEWPMFGAAHFHGDVEVNERLCAGCHVEMFTADNGFNSVGHLFEAIPCVDGDGVPVPGGSCDLDDRRWSACTDCHGTVENSQYKYELYNEELTGYLKSIWDDVNRNDTLDVAGADTGLLVRIVQLGDWTILNQDDDYFTVAEGVLFNAQLAHTHETPWFEDAYYPIGADSLGSPEYDEFGSHPASGGGMHNPTLLRSLLVASLSAGANQYNVAPPAGVSLQLPEDSPIKKK
jgi:predicted CXXCH cytochrome family protein